MPLFRLWRGFLVRPWITFPRPSSIIPDGGISPVRLEMKTCHTEPSVVARPVKRWHACRIVPFVCFVLRVVSGHSLSAQCPSILAQCSTPSSPRAPLLQGHYPPSLLLRAHAPLPMPLIVVSLSLSTLPLPLVPSTAGHQELPGFILLIFPEVPRPLPRRSVGCT